ncbi:alpha/beta hydrolase [Streptomyces apocyni]|uniref:alpha/beta hydrolase n=1 Tax=Streptomyces apocyni TaxID=2654677 RepID=UPI0012EA8DA9|nr:alpha/beta hydrolase [Streptomyces apocyni]
MRTYASKALLATLSAAAVAATLTGAAPASRTTESGVPRLDWRDCAQPGGGLDGQECADLPVPLDYRDPDGPHVTLAVTRLRSDRPDARRGTLLVIPGGPGGSGIQKLRQKGAALRAEMGGAYDIVSFDPRGVGGSTKARCGLRADDRMLVNLRPWPGADGQIGENVARSQRVARSCARHGGAVLRSLSTANEVRDIDRFRQALGEEKLSAWGISYGTYVGAVYAQKYPQHTDRWVLDSSGDPDPERVARGWLANMSAGAEERFPDFAAWAADPARDAEGERLRLAERAADVRPLVLALAARLDRAPKETTTAGVPLTGNVLRQAVQNALYSDAAFPELARLVRAAQDPDLDPDLDRKPVLPGALAGPMSDQDAAVTMAVVCNDARWPRAVPGYARAVAADRARYPLTAGMSVNITPCAFWKGAPSEKPTRITSDGPSNVLMIQSLRDPATPYFGALKMREAFGQRARMVTVGPGGHGVYLGEGNACGDRAVTEFLTEGRRPARDQHCA